MTWLFPSFCMKFVTKDVSLSIFWVMIYKKNKLLNPLWLINIHFYINHNTWDAPLLPILSWERCKDFHHQMLVFCTEHPNLLWTELCNSPLNKIVIAIPAHFMYGILLDDGEAGGGGGEEGGVFLHRSLLVDKWFCG